MSELLNVEARPTLKQLATVLDCPLTRVSSVAHKPQSGVAYDPKAINWPALDAFVANRLEKSGYDSVEAVYEAALEVEIPERAKAQPKAMLTGTTPFRKEVNVGDTIAMKGEDTQYEVLYTDDTIVVFRALDAEGLAISHAIGNRVFNNKFYVIK